MGESTAIPVCALGIVMSDWIHEYWLTAIATAVFPLFVGGIIWAANTKKARRNAWLKEADKRWRENPKQYPRKPRRR